MSPVLGESKFVELNEDGPSWLLTMKGKSRRLRKGCVTRTRGSKRSRGRDSGVTLFYEGKKREIKGSKRHQSDAIKSSSTRRALCKNVVLHSPATTTATHRFFTYDTYDAKIDTPVNITPPPTMSIFVSRAPPSLRWFLLLLPCILRTHAFLICTYWQSRRCYFAGRRCVC